VGETSSVWLYGDDAYTVSTLHESDQTGEGVNFVVSDFNHTPLGTYYPRWRRTSGTGPIDCQWEGSVGGLVFQPGEITSTLQSFVDLDVAEAFDLLVDGGIPGGQDVTIRVEDRSGEMDLGVAVFRSHGAEYYGNPSDAIALADETDTGGSESVSFVATADDAYGLIIFNQNDTGGLYRLVFQDEAAGTPEIVNVPSLDLRASTANPFVREAGLRLALPGEQEIDLAIYDVAGRRVRELLAGPCAGGLHSVSWDGRDGGGRDLPSGVYLARLKAGGRELQVKLVRCL
jgi:hypothetical protein